MDARTVDGETPLKLAERGGHAEVVQVIEEEVESRKTRELEEKALEERMEMMELKAEGQVPDEFADVEEETLWKTSMLASTKVEEIELAPDEVAK